MSSKTINVDVDIDLYVVDANGDDVPDGAYELEDSFGTITVKLKKSVFPVMNNKELWNFICDYACFKAPEILPELEKIKIQLELKGIYV